MSAPDFNTLMSTPVDSFKEPPPLPNGTYLGKLAKYEIGKSREKQTPFIRYTVQLLAPGEDVDAAQLEGIDVTQRAFRYDLYVTPDAMFRVKEFFLKLGIEPEGRGTNELLTETQDREVMVTIAQRPGTGKNTGKTFAEIVDLAAAPE
jgi:hypothetical protein